MARAVERTSTDDTYLEEDEGDRPGSFVDQFDLQHYLRVLRKSKWPITLFTAVITSLAAYYAFTATPVYRATSTLLIESQQTNVVSIEDLVGVETENQEYYQTQFELLRSRGLARRVIDHLELWEHPEFVPAVIAGGDEADVEAVDSDGSGLGGFIDGVRGRIGLDTAAEAQSSSEDATIEEGGVASTDGAVDVGPDVPDSALGISLDAMPEYAVDADYFDEREVLRDARKLAVLARFMNRLTISPVRNTKLVRISFDSPDPVLAARVSNAVAEQYITSYLDARMELTTRASQWLNERLGDLKRILDESEDRLIAFKEANGLVDVDGSVGRLNEQELLLVTAELAQARSELSGAADLYRETQALRDRPGLLESLPVVQADPLVQNVKIQKGQAQRELDELRNRYGDRHPRVVDATSRLESLDTTLRGHIERVVGSIAKDYQLVQQRVASIESKLASGKRDIQAIGTKKFELDALEREVATNQQIYDTFFSRITEAKSADGLEAANARVSDYAAPPRAPIKPQKQLIVALAAFASLVLSMLMAILYEQMDDTVRSTGDIEKKVGQRLLGILPLVKGGMFSRGRELPLIPLEIPDRKGTFAEAVRTVRTALALEGADNKVIMVTSSVPGEGKSTTAINIAYSLAQLERVLLIDCDMRRPTIAKAAGFERDTVGLSELITRAASPRQCIKPAVFDGAVDVLPSGRIPDQPLELLSSKRFEKILEKLRDHYDRIVIDCAPTQAVSDALVLARVSDAVVYAVKSNDTSIDLVQRGILRLQQVKAKIAGVVITQVDVEKITSYGGDYYYQGYYDYYGYTEDGALRSSSGGKLRLTPEELLEIRNDDADVELDLGYESVPDTGQARLETEEPPATFRTRDERPVTRALQRSAVLEDEISRTGGTTAGDRRPVGSSRRVREDLDIL